MNSFDVVVIGAGPAGLTAAGFAARQGAKVLVLERGLVGGQLNYAPKIANYPASEPKEGFKLAAEFKDFALKAGVEIREMEEVKKLMRREIITSKDKYAFKALVLAPGTVPKPLGLREERMFVGKGLSYCAVCDGFFFKGKPVAVIGNGQEGVTEAVFFSSLASELVFIAPSELKPQLAKQLETIGARVVYGKVTKIFGNARVEGIVVENGGQRQEIRVEGIFVALGRRANTGFLKGFVEMIDGFIKVDTEMRTSREGVFACGDAVAIGVKQVASAVGSGCIAGLNAAKYALG